MSTSPNRDHAGRFRRLAGGPQLGPSGSTQARLLGEFAGQFDADAADGEVLAAAAAVMRRRFGGLETTIAVLDAKAAALRGEPSR